MTVARQSRASGRGRRHPRRRGQPAPVAPATCPHAARHLVILGGEGAGRWLGIGRQARATLMSPVLRQRLGTFLAVTRRQDLLVLNELVETGAVRPVVDRTYGLPQAAAAVRHLSDGHPRGKIVLAISPRRERLVVAEAGGPALGAASSARASAAHRPRAASSGVRASGRLEVHRLRASCFSGVTVGPCRPMRCLPSSPTLPSHRRERCEWPSASSNPRTRSA
jgi:hypothetical protein